MRRTPGWTAAARPTRWFGVAFLVLVVLLAAVEASSVAGLAERLVVAIGAAAIAALAVRVARSRAVLATQ